MKRLNLSAALLLLLSALTFSSCQAIADIFKAGMGFGIFIAVVVVAAIVFFIMKAAKGKDS